MLRKCFPDNLCRLCGLEKNQGTDVCSLVAKKSGLLSKINKRLSKEGVHIAMGDKLPKFVCCECEVIINDFTEFCKMVNQVQKRLELEELNVKVPPQKSPIVSAEPTREELNQQKNVSVGCPLADTSATVSVGPDGKVECKMCQSYLEAVEHTTLHMVTHGIGTVICHCRMCGHKAELARFVRSNGREENSAVWCENCQFQPTSQIKKGSKVKNKNKNPKQKTHHCEICTKVFHSKAHLSRHQIVHSGAKPFLCEVCGTGFGQKSSLKLHVLTHTGLNPHKCDHCGQCFRFRSSLQSHIMSMHWPNSGTNFGSKKRVYICDHCGKQFATAYKLNRHYRCHTGDRPFECEDCGRLFSQSCNLNLHRKKHRQFSLSERKPPTPCFETVLHKDHLTDSLTIKSSEQFNSISTQQPNPALPAAVPFGNDAEVLTDTSDSEFLETILQHPIINLRVEDEPFTPIDTVFDPHDKSPDSATQFVSLPSDFTSGSSHLTPECGNITNENEKKTLQEKADLFPDFTHEGLMYINQSSTLPTDSPTNNVTLPTFSSLQTGPPVSLPSIPH